MLPNISNTHSLVSPSCCNSLFHNTHSLLACFSKLLQFSIPQYPFLACLFLQAAAILYSTIPIPCLIVSPSCCNSLFHNTHSLLACFSKLQLLQFILNFTKKNSCERILRSTAISFERQTQKFESHCRQLESFSSIWHERFVACFVSV